MFNIPMNTGGAMDSSSLLSLNSPQPQVAPTPVQQPVTPTPVQQPANPTPVRPATSGGGIRIKKGQKTTLAGAGESLGVIKVCLAWDLVNQACDLDGSAFMLGANGKVLGDSWFVFYGQTVSPDGAIRHSGDADGSAAGFDEIITVDTSRVNPGVARIPFVVTIDEALTQGLNFSMVRNAYVCVINGQTNAEICRFDLTDYYATVTSMVVGELYRHNGTWKFSAVGDGVAQDLAGLCAMYGVNVAD